MKFVFTKVRKDALPNPKQTKTYLDGRIGFWGNVHDVDAKTGKVTVVADTGQTIPGLPIASAELVNAGDEFLSGTRKLPKKGTRVFVLMPTGTLTGAFILCSGFTPGEPNEQKLFAKDDTEANKIKDVAETVTQSGWNEKEFYKNGNVVYQSKDEKIKISVILSDDNENSLKKSVSVEAWGQKITIDDKSMKIEANQDMEIKADKKKIKIDAANVEICGGSKNLVTWSELNQGLQTLWNIIKTHTHNVTTAGSPTAQTGTAFASPNLAGASLNISSAKTGKVKVE